MKKLLIKQESLLKFVNEDKNSKVRKVLIFVILILSLTTFKSYSQGVGINTAEDKQISRQYWILAVQTRGC